MSEVAQAREMTPWELFISRVRNAAIRFRRKLPYVVWYDQELDVVVRFLAKRLDANSAEDAFAQFWNGQLHDAYKKLNEAGITFDAGIGFEGLDWEWDFSLSGPVSVRFRSRAKRPERRGWDEALQHLQVRSKKDE